MKKDDIIKEIKDGWLFTPHDVENFINMADKYPSVETIKRILEIEKDIMSDCILYDYTLTIDDMAKKIEQKNG